MPPSAGRCSMVVDVGPGGCGRRADGDEASMRASWRATSAAVMVPNASIAYTIYTVPCCEAPATDNGYIRGVARMLQDERGDVGVL